MNNLFVPPLLTAISLGSPLEQVRQFFNQQNLFLLAPEIIILTTLLFSVFQTFHPDEKERQNTWWLALVGLVFALVCLFLHFFSIYMPDLLMGGIPSFSQSVFFNMFQADLFSWIFRTFLVVGTLVVLLLTRRYLDARTPVPGEFYLILLGSLLGGMMVTGSIDLIMLFVALETLGISSYILAGYIRGDARSAEASLKYLLYGGMSTAVLLFGFSLLYGLTKSTSYPEIAMAMQSLQGPIASMIPLMVVLILAGFSFKLSAAPFHMWTPDVYEGAPTPVSAYLSVVSKMAGFAMTVRFLTTILAGLPGWMGIVAVLSVLSMVIGNIVALSQKNVKRLLAYSTIAHAGYILLGLVTPSTGGVPSVIYYLLTYLFMNMGAFTAVIYFENLTGTSEIQAFAGLGRKRPLLTFAFTIFLLSLAGIPITAGFFAKFFVFQSVAQAGGQYLWLVVLALLTSTISLYYYLNIIRLMVIAEPSEAVNQLSDLRLERGPNPLGFALAISLVGTLFLGFWASPLLNLAGASMKSMVSITQSYAGVTDYLSMKHTVTK